MTPAATRSNGLAHSHCISTRGGTAELRAKASWSRTLWYDRLAMLSAMPIMRACRTSQHQRARARVLRGNMGPDLRTGMGHLGFYRLGIHGRWTAPLQLSGSASGRPSRYDADRRERVDGRPVLIDSGPPDLHYPLRPGPRWRNFSYFAFQMDHITWPTGASQRNSSTPMPNSG